MTHSHRRFGVLVIVLLLAPSPGRPQPAPPAAAELAGKRTVYDFLTNRAHAVLHRGGRLVINAGDLSFLKFVDGGWKTSWILGSKDGGKPVAFVAGLSAARS